jgi:hypothetical protein
MKRILTILFIALIAIAVYAAVTLLGSDRSVMALDDTVEFIAPEEYYVTQKAFKLQNTGLGQGKVLLPKPFDVGEFGLKPTFNRQSGFVGPESCRDCHAEYYDGFVQTAHYTTSSVPSKETIKGELSPGANLLKTKIEGFRYEVGQGENDFFQTLKIDRDGKTYEHKKRIDIVTGSGTHGQTHLYWEDDLLYQLPVSWFAKSGWVNSPGYPDGFANFARPVREDCMTCHATLVEFAEKRVNLVDRSNMILGVTCERCHGPGEQHVAFHRQNPNADGAKFITHPNDLPRERMNDICGQCHTGLSQVIQSPFNFRPGDSIHDFKRFPKESTSGGGVHTANQHPRLLMSKCYSETDSMNCATCHNPHQNEHANLQLFSQRCMKCHQVEDCGQFPTSGKRIASNCIDCHMPKQKDQKIKMETVAESEAQFPEIRDHFIRIEPTATKQVLETWASEK